MGQGRSHRDLFQGGQIGAAELDTTKGSAWGLLNAATQHIDHEAGRSTDARVKSAWFGARRSSDD